MLLAPSVPEARLPIFVMTHTAHEAIEKDGTTYTFVVDDVANAIASARQAAVARCRCSKALR